MGIARKILMRTIAESERDGRFPKSVISSFNKYAVNYCGSVDPIKSLGEIEWQKPAFYELFIRFLNAVDDDKTTPVEPINETNEKQADVESKGDSVSNFVDEIIKKLSRASQEADELLKSLSVSNGTITNMRREIEDRDIRISELSVNVSERDRAIADLKRKINDDSATLSENEVRIADLSDRLKNSLQMDNITQNQELITLKSNLQNSLKIEYSDYIASKDTECNPDTYGALIGTLTRIFKTLRRYGIAVE